MRFRLEEKIIAQVKYYEWFYVITDDKGDRLYTGTDEKTAKLILKILNGYSFRKDRKLELAKKRKKK